MKIFVGYDSTQQVAYDTCVKSIKYNSNHNHIIPLKLDELISKKIYWRTDKGSTEFSFTRFLVPYLCDYEDFAVFCDSDFIWNVNIDELLDVVYEDKAVWVCKHNIVPGQLKSTKMDGKPQRWYPRKNWSSLMLFNCSHSACREMIPHTVSSQSPGYLHELRWCSDNEIGSLPLNYNYLVGYNLDVEEKKAIHFTDGGPWHEGYENVEYSNLWHFYKELNNV